MRFVAEVSLNFLQATREYIQQVLSLANVKRFPLLTKELRNF